MNFQNFHIFYYDLCVSKKLNDTIIILYHVYTALLTELSVGVPIIDDPHDVLTGVATRFPHDVTDIKSTSMIYLKEYSRKGC